MSQTETILTHPVGVRYEDGGLSPEMPRKLMKSKDRRCLMELWLLSYCSPVDEEKYHPV